MTTKTGLACIATLLHWAHAARATDLRYTANADGTTNVHMRVHGTPQPIYVSGAQHRDIVEAILTLCPNLAPTDYNTIRDDSFTYTLESGQNIHVRFAMLTSAETPNDPIAITRIVYSDA